MEDERKKERENERMETVSHTEGSWDEGAGGGGVEGGGGERARKSLERMGDSRHEQTSRLGGAGQNIQCTHSFKQLIFFFSFFKIGRAHV